MKYLGIIFIVLLPLISNPLKFYLTIDDGPTAYTEYLHSQLKNLKVTPVWFFSSQDKISVTTLKNLMNDGILVGCHTWSHKYKGTWNEYNEDISKWVNYWTNLPGPSFLPIFRAPGGSFNNALLVAVQQKHWKNVGWSMQFTIPESNYVEHLKENAKPTRVGYYIVLLHESRWLCSNIGNVITEMEKYGKVESLTKENYIEVLTYGNN